MDAEVALMFVITLWKIPINFLSVQNTIYDYSVFSFFISQSVFSEADSEKVTLFLFSF